jgi:hypothetical protein
MLRQGSHELGIPPRVLPDARLDPLDPQFGPFPPLSSAVPIPVLPRLVQTSDGNAETVLGPPSKTFGMFQQVLVLKCGYRRRRMGHGTMGGGQGKEQ